MNHRELHPRRQRGNILALTAFWGYVGIPLAWGVTSTLQKATALFA